MKLLKYILILALLIILFAGRLATIAKRTPSLNEVNPTAANKLIQRDTIFPTKVYRSFECNRIECSVEINIDTKQLYLLNSAKKTTDTLSVTYDSTTFKDAYIVYLTEEKPTNPCTCIFEESSAKVGIVLAEFFKVREDDIVIRKFAGYQVVNPN